MRRCAPRWGVGVPLGLVALCLAAYANSITNPFVYDDGPIILEDPRVQQGDWPALLTGNYWPSPSSARHYRPLVKISYAVNHAIAPQAWAFRLPNIALHAATTVALFFLAMELFGSRWVALIAGVCFALHPVHTEPVNAIVGRADLIVAFGVLSAGLLLWRDSAPDATRRLGRPIIAAVLFAVSLLCKENAVTLLGVVVLLDWWRWRRGEAAGRRWLFQRAMRAYVPLIVILIVYLGAREALVPQPDQAVPAARKQVDNAIAAPSMDLEENGSALLARWATPVVTFGLAAKLLVWPAQLCCDYSYKAIETVKRISDARLGAAIVWMVVVIAAVIVSLRRRGGVALSIGLTLVTYSIVSNLPIVIGTIFAERLLYLPSAGVCLCIGLLGGSCVEAFSQSATVRRAVGAAGLGIVTLMAGWYAHLTLQRNGDWRSDETLWAAAERVNPRSCRVLNHRAQHMLKEGRFEEALQYAQRAMEIAPAHWNAWRTAGVAFRRQGKLDQAIDHFQQAIDRGGAADDAAVFGLVEVLVMRGQRDRAMELIESGLALRPGWRLGRYWAGVLLTQTGRTPEAIARLDQLVRDYPEWTTPRFTLAELLAQTGRVDSAITHLQELLATEPGNRAALIRCAEYLRQVDRYEQAIAYLRKAVREKAEVAVLNNLALWLISAEPESLRNADEALEHIRLAASMAPDNGAVVDTHVAVLLALGTREDAINELKRALDVIPADDPLRPALAERLSSLQSENPLTP